MTKQKYFYKVLTNDQTSISAEGDLEVSYTTRKFVEAPKFMQDKGYHLLVFLTKKDVSKFAMLNNTSHIWKCECQEVQYDDLPQRKRINYGRFDPFVFPVEWPPGTVMAKKVKLIQKVKPNRGYEATKVKTLIKEEKEEFGEILKTSQKTAWLFNFNFIYCI